MKQMKEISFKDRDAIFGRLEELASRGKMSKEERAQYDYEWKIYNDYLNSFNSAEKKGLAEGHAKGLEEGLAEGRAKGLVEGEKKRNLEIAKNLKAMGLSFKSIIQATGLTIEEIEKL